MKTLSSTSPKTFLAATVPVLMMLAGCGSEKPAGQVESYSKVDFIPDELCEKSGPEKVLVNCAHTFSGGQVLEGGNTVFDLRLLNSGDANLELLSIQMEYEAPEGAVEAVPAFQMALPADVDAALSAGESYLVAPSSAPSADYAEEISIRIVFSRYDDGLERSAKLVITVHDRAINVKDQTVEVALGVSEGAAEIKVSPDIMDFGQVWVGQAPEKNLTILNVGSENLVLTGFALTGNDFFTLLASGSEYPVSAETAAGVTLASPIEIEPNSTFFFKVRFAPTDDQKADAVLTIFSSDPTKTEGAVVLLKGNQTGPCITVNPAQVKFGGKLVGDLATLPLEITSCGDADLELYNFGFGPDSSPDYSVDVSPLDHQPAEGDPVVVPPEGKVTVNVQFVPDVENPTDMEGMPIPDLGTLIISNNSFYRDKDVQVTGFGSKFACPTAIIDCDQGHEVIPQTVLQLQSSASYAAPGTISAWLWEVEQPDGSKSVFLPGDFIPNPKFEVNIAGKYTFYLTVWDDKNVASCIKDKYEVLVIPDEAIHIELMWRTDGDPDETDTGPGAGSDLDLHFLHPYASGPDVDLDGKADGWFDQPYDCFWYNPHPNWGAFDSGVNDDPGLDRDDTDGAGPENVNLNIPEANSVYRVGVHFWNDHGFGKAYATVRIYVYSQLVFEVTDVLLGELDMWDVATIAWPSAKVTPITTATGQYKITAKYRSPLFNPND